MGGLVDLNMIIRIIPILFLLSATYSQTIIGDGLTGQPLLDYVVNNYKTSTTLGYANARDTMYSVIDLKDDNQLSCIYSGYTITLDLNEDPSVNAFNQGINCEHTWPQSMGAGQEPQKSDMHHLYPCKSNVNSSRGNHPYAEIPDEDTDIWYRNDYSQDNIPTEFINEYAEKYNSGDAQFEPREDHKGDASRAMFYFFAMYHDVADTNFWNTQKDILLDWHYFDPVGYWEYNRTWSIAVYQENIPNPFVLDSTLSRRIWFFQAQDTSNYNGPVWYVSTTGSDSTGDGTEENPFATIQTAIDTAGESDTVLVSAGTYFENLIWPNTNGIKLIGAGDTTNTIIDGSNADASVIFMYPSSDTLIDTTTLIRNFRIINGSGTPVQGYSAGGGLLIREASVTIENLYIAQNTAVSGAAMLVAGSNSVMDGLIIRNNVIDYDGEWSGDLINIQSSSLQLSNTSIINNTLVGEYSYNSVFNFFNDENIELSNILISGNQNLRGSEVELTDNLSLINVEIENNYSGMNFSEWRDTYLFENVSIHDNDTTGLYISTFIDTAQLENILLYNNSTNLNINQGTPLSTVSHLTSVNGDIILQSHITIINSIIDLNPDHNIIDYGSATIQYSLITTGWEGEGNIDADPLFCNPDSGDYTLAENSPCVGTGEDGANMGALGVGCGIQVDWDFSLSEPVIEVMGTDNVWNPGDTISVEMDFCNNTDVAHNWYPGVTIESDSSLTSLHSGHIWFYAMVADECHAISWGAIANTSIISDTIVEFRAYPEALNCQNQPEYCIDGDTLTFEIPIVVQVVSTEPEHFIPEEFVLHQNYPNPFNPVTTLRYDLPDNGHVNITIYDMLGRQVKTLINQTQDAGYRSIIWDATNDYGKPVSAGIYLYQIQAGEYISTKKMVLLK